ncbi:MAG: hypothetical protein RLZZ165_739 [Bacteroidota bacterium]|jgi:cytochrome bd-type quinol oxidase subunit 1
MITSLKLFMGAVLALSGVAAFLIGYTQSGILLQLIFGKERVKKTGTRWLALYLYIAAGVLLLTAFLLLLP